MKVVSKDLPKSQIELTVELTVEEFKPYIQKGALKISQDVKIAGFRPGKVPYDILKSKIGEMTILEEAARIAINKTIDQAIEKDVKGTPIGSPQISISKLAPDNPLEYKITLVLLPKIDIGEYKGLKVKQEKAKVETKDIEKTLNQLREARVVEKIIDRAAKVGDKIIIGIEMFLDKVPVDGGQTPETAIVLGKDFIIPGFDKQLIGAKKGDEKEFKLPYPKEHHMKNLAGKMVEFKVKVKEVYERKLPIINDDFAKNFGLNNVKSLKENIEKSILAEKEQELNQKTDAQIIDKILEKTKFSEIPELLINNEVKGVISELEYMIQSQGGKFDDYLASVKKTRDQLTLDFLPQALKRVKGSLLVRELAIREEIKAEEKEVEKKQAEMLKQYKGQKEIEEKIHAPEYKSHLRNSLINEKAIKKLREWNLTECL